MAYISLSLYRFYIPPLWMSETDPALAVLRLALGWERRGRLCRVYIFNRFFMSARHSEWRLLTLRGKQASISCAVKIMAVPNTYWLTMLWLLVCVWLWVGVGGVRGLCVCVFVCVCMLVCEMHARLKFVCVYTSTHACNFVCECICLFLCGGSFCVRVYVSWYCLCMCVLVLICIWVSAFQKTFIFYSQIHISLSPPLPISLSAVVSGWAWLLR